MSARSSHRMLMCLDPWLPQESLYRKWRYSWMLSFQYLWQSMAMWFVSDTWCREMRRIRWLSVLRSILDLIRCIHRKHCLQSWISMRAMWYHRLRIYWKMHLLRWWWQSMSYPRISQPQECWRHWWEWCPWLLLLIRSRSCSWCLQMRMRQEWKSLLHTSQQPTEPVDSPIWEWSWEK